MISEEADLPYIVISGKQFFSCENRRATPEHELSFWDEQPIRGRLEGRVTFKEEKLNCLV